MRGLTLVDAKQCTVLPHIAASVFINGDAGLWAGCNTAPVRTPVQGGQDRRRACEAAWAAKRSRGGRGDGGPAGWFRFAHQNLWHLGADLPTPG